MRQYVPLLALLAVLTALGLVGALLWDRGSVPVSEPVPESAAISSEAQATELVVLESPQRAEHEAPSAVQPAGQTAMFSSGGVPTPEELSRVRRLLRERFGGRSADELTEAERWFERFCLLRLNRAEFDQASAADRCSIGQSFLMPLVLATWLDLAGRWSEDRPTAGRGAFTMQVNARYYTFSRGEFPEYDTLVDLVNGVHDGDSEWAPSGSKRSALFLAIDTMADEAEQLALPLFDQEWLR